MPFSQSTEPYNALAAVYNQAHLTDYSLRLAPRLLERAFTHRWIGRTLLDLGCGTGEVACFLASQGYRTIALDNSAAMLTVGAASAAQRGLQVDWLRADLRTFTIGTTVDLVLLIGGTLNLLPTLQDMESAIQRVSAALDPEKLFIFDLDTVRGLAAEGDYDRVLFDDERNVLLVAQSRFNYEALLRSTTYQVLTAEGSAWRRADETHLQRAFPIQAILRALQKAGLRLIETLDTALEPTEASIGSRLILVAQKGAAG